MKNGNAEMIPVTIGDQTIMNVTAGTEPRHIHCAGGGGGRTPDRYSGMGGGGSKPVLCAAPGSGGGKYYGPVCGSGGRR